MRILISGSSGLVGSHLVPQLVASGHEVLRLVRKRSNKLDEIYWNPEQNELELSSAGTIDAVIHLAGAGIAEKRWNEDVKAEILKSRVLGTRLLATTVASLPSPPSVFLSASAVGFYGNSGSILITEDASPGSGFLSDVCRAWENETLCLAKPIRVVNLRFGVILSPAGGALKRMLLPFRFGLGGKLGNGKQYISWITLPDALRAIAYCLTEAGISGPVNIVAPHPATNLEFTKSLGRTLFRPTILPVPAILIRLVLGEMGRELLLEGTRAIPKKLLDNGFNFEQHEIAAALSALLK